MVFNNYDILVLYSATIILWWIGSSPYIILDVMSCWHGISKDKLCSVCTVRCGNHAELMADKRTGIQNCHFLLSNQ